MNISLFKNYRELNGYDKYKIVNYYYKNKGVCIGDISKNLNVSDRAVRRVLKEEGINTRLKNRYVLDECYFACIDTEAKAYILGFIYADGFVGDENHNNIVVYINDLEILEFMANELQFTGDIRRTKKGGFENSKEGYSLFNYLYDKSTIKLERKYNKWNEIKSAFTVGAVKQIG